MYSNFITPPDFVEDRLPTITLINPTDDEVESVARVCALGEECFNVYVYRSDMNNSQWLEKAISLSEAVILNSVDSQFDHLCALDKTYYYGDRQFLTPATTINLPDEYFVLRKNLV